MSDKTQHIRVGEHVMYAGAPYVVQAIRAGLVTLDGVADWQTQRCRERTTVLVTDVTRMSSPAPLTTEDAS